MDLNEKDKEHLVNQHPPYKQTMPTKPKLGQPKQKMDEFATFLQSQERPISPANVQAKRRRKRNRKRNRQTSD